MKFPKNVKAFCPFCNAHTEHKVKIASKGKRRTMSIGDRKHERTLLGHGGKRKGKKAVRKQGKNQVLVLTCNTCKKSVQKVIKGKKKKKIEIKR